ncbi:hypothetical protein C7974DRAFT_476839 [Boeremia exigua]|uniref:uncharacterized protein n=1 Tax=Boeremia exigua TaxID=749465 RepID=UPI001E8CBCAB|nr:uncharacterized protein C7974DRAFT_476839 [Boeremia exigua]KAH6612147.1 hypothetical protein C7974DRAFT_476839 [Boeremia exigua]
MNFCGNSLFPRGLFVLAQTLLVLFFAVTNIRIRAFVTQPGRQRMSESHVVGVYSGQRSPISLAWYQRFVTAKMHRCGGSSQSFVPIVRSQVKRLTVTPTVWYSSNVLYISRSNISDDLPWYIRTGVQ